MTALSQSAMPRRRALWTQRLIVLALLLLGAALRFPGIGRVPPGLYHDEAQHGLDALYVLEGHRPLYFEANNGREPLFIYLVTATVALLGRTPVAIRLPSASVGFLTLAATYRCARALWNRKVAVGALAVITVTFWHVHLSRVGFRAVLLPLFTALFLAEAAQAIRYGHQRHWIAAGVLYGAGWYTYMAARFTPVALAGLLLYGLLAHREAVLRHRRGILIFAVSAVFVLLPLGIYTLSHPDVVLTRADQVSIFSETINGGDFWDTLGRHTLATLRMFTGRGDRIWRHNLAWRPVWDPALSTVFLMGLGVALARFRRDAGAALSLVWTATMALPTLLAEDAPHFLRGVGVLPTAVFLPALGLGWLQSRINDNLLQNLSRRRAYLLATLVPAACVGLGLFATAYDYFERYVEAPLTYHWLEGGPVALAETVNALRGEGWNGEKMVRAGTSGTDSDDRVFIDEQLWVSWTATPFLVPAPAVSFVPPTEAIDLDPGAAFIVWPYRDWEEDVFPYVPRPAYLRVERGPEVQGDKEPEPYTLAMIVRAEQVPDIPTPIATFEGGIQLRAALVEPSADEATRVNLWWDTTGPIADAYTVFVHYQRQGQRITSDDGQPGLGHLPTSAWQVGDLILDIHSLSGVRPRPNEDTLRIGLYHAETGADLQVINADGVPYTDAVELPVIIAAP